MRRLVITFAVMALGLSVAPAGALARHHDRRHRSRVHHPRIERLGHDATSAPNSSSTGNAGTVASFHNGVLTVMLGNGSTVSGAVTGDTETECVAPEQHQTFHEDGDSVSGQQSGDRSNSGSGDDQAQSSGDQRSGDDRGDAAEQNENQAEDQNENQAEHNCSMSSLTPGATVREAELRISGGGNTWRKVELGS